MSFPKLLAILAVVLFGTIFVAFLFKEKKESSPTVTYTPSAPLEIELDQEIAIVTPVHVPPASYSPTIKSSESVTNISSGEQSQPPEADRIEELFNKIDPRLPIVETIIYKSKVAWQQGRPAWLSDYANHYRTSRHFIARSLNGKPDYLKQDIAEGARFNVFRSDKNFNFHLVIDLSRCKMWFYYYDEGSNERVLLKTYAVGLGRVESSKASGLLTPLGTYILGDKIAIYKPKMMGPYNGEKIEMIKVFGTRWIPFETEVGECTAPAKGFGIHGNPWHLTEAGQLVEDTTSIGKYQSDGCIRLTTADVEELFAVMITRPTTVYLVKDFYDAKLPGIEK